MAYHHALSTKLKLKKSAPEHVIKLLTAMFNPNRFVTRTTPGVKTGTQTTLDIAKFLQDYMDYSNGSDEVIKCLVTERIKYRIIKTVESDIIFNFRSNHRCYSIPRWHWSAVEEMEDYWVLEAHVISRDCNYLETKQFIEFIKDYLILEEGDILHRNTYEEGDITDLVVYVNGEIVHRELTIKEEENPGYLEEIEGRMELGFRGRLYSEEEMGNPWAK